MKLKTAQTMKKHILNWYKRADLNLKMDGLQWYEEANNFVQDTVDTCELNARYSFSQVVSILSPQVDWETNKKNAVAVYQTWKNKGDVLGLKMFATELQKINALNALEGTYRIPEKARKTRSFALNIFKPDLGDSVTIDRHAVKVALNDLKAGGVSLTTKQYDLAADCYRKVADKIGIKPCQLQAVTWLQYKKEVNR